MAFAPAQGSGSGIGATTLQVQGTANDGAAEVGNPVQIGGVDGAGNAQALSVDTGGRVDVNLISGQSAITAGAGTVAANTPRATLASDDPAVAALQVMDDWDETNRAAVNPVVGQAGLAAGTGIDAVNALRVSLATDVAMPTGTNILGRVGVDQTTPGTTDSVSVATAQGAGATIGTTADASVPTDATGTLSGKLRGAVANLVTTLTRLGAATDAAVITDADGSLHAKARGVVALLAPASTIANAQVSVGIASQEIVATRAGRRSLGIRNLGTAAEKVYLGAGTVTNANGFLIEAGESIEVLDCTAAVNGIADGTTVSCSYLEVY